MAAEAGEPADVVLLARTDAAAQRAFGTLVRRHGRVLYAIAYSRLGSASDAEETVQDAFLLLWRKRGGVRLVGDSVLPWLVVSTKHLAANRLRARYRRLSTERAAAEPESSRDPQDVADDLVERALARLSPVDAAVARLCLGEELTYAEAAVRLGLTPGAVRNRLSRARARLRGDLAAQGATPGAEDHDERGAIVSGPEPTDEQLRRIEARVRERIGARVRLPRQLATAAAVLVLAGGGFALVVPLLGGSGSSGSTAGGGYGAASSEAGGPAPAAGTAQPNTDVVTVRCHVGASPRSRSAPLRLTAVPTAAEAREACDRAADGRASGAPAPGTEGSAAVVCRRDRVFEVLPGATGAEAVCAGIGDSVVREEPTPIASP